jgi:hypothetical protein
MPKVPIPFETFPTGNLRQAYKVEFLLEAFSRGQFIADLQISIPYGTFSILKFNVEIKIKLFHLTEGICAHMNPYVYVVSQSILNNI